MENKIRIGSLWIGRTKSGEGFFSGPFGSGARLLVFRNSFKQGDSDPDYAVFVVPREREGGERIEQGSAQRTPSNRNAEERRAHGAERHVP